jgi:phosphotransferase system HPr (HPr) family protein
MKSELKLTIKHKVGLHARPASLFVQTANKFSSKITVKNLSMDAKAVNAKSILGVLTLGVVQNHEISIVAEGEDAAQATQALYSLIESNFGESS